MGDAFDLVRTALPEQRSEEIASYIIGLAQTGVTDTATLAAQALDFLNEDRELRPEKGSSPFG